MKTWIAVALAAASLLAAGAAVAGRDAGEMLRLQRAMETKQAEQIALARQSQQGLAGATGVAGKPGPATTAPRAGRRNPAAHP